MVHKLMEVGASGAEWAGCVRKGFARACFREVLSIPHLALDSRGVSGVGSNGGAVRNPCGGKQAP